MIRKLKNNYNSISLLTFLTFYNDVKIEELRCIGIDD